MVHAAIYRSISTCIVIIPRKFVLHPFHVILGTKVNIHIIECVHCHAIKKSKSKTIQWIKSRNCDIVDYQ